MHMRIGGEEIASAEDRWMPVINPATGVEIDRVPRGSATEVDLAVRAAGDAFDGWAKKTVRERGMVLFRAAHLVREDHEALARTLTAEQGKPIREATDEIRGFANILEFYAGISAGIRGDLLPLGPLGDCLVTREPLGVCGAIVPWNMPALIMGWKVGPALLAGNTMVFKPASQTPITALKITALMEHAGLPPGVLNLVTGPGEAVGEAIARHPGIAKVSFTGDTATGCRIRELAAGGLKALTLELGGSDPMIVWKDADLEKAAAGAVRGRFYNSGQTCTAVKRLFVHQSVAPEFMRLLMAKVNALRVGNGMVPGVDMGPLAGNFQRERIVSLMDELRARDEGKIVAGGYVPVEGDLSRGYYYAPTIVTDPHPGSALLCREVFGPVLPVMCIPDLDAAISEANRSPYGLGASVWTRDLGVAKEVFSRVRAGVIWVNRHLTVPPEVPFGGVKESGIGRENGVEAYHSYTRTKSLFLGW
ncbi:succinate-semialdehyde dehydrogenase/glutarate-semialdehyde dehydrogenase [Methanolinea mesophila]|uniref:aldehyde dehydrogenase family protein n=1 Tax=Methanolinea mesophila TaxID=547055 RepID=UPI001AE37CA9|nr:aldehyde dehydrogenase family protein [Methanolinea mesophila]MBP1928849.1 succinate-semialdehyde dehydrogenase/glutarate-semialdehyde dehydrogenase [Methanolinea mesophila]